MKVNPLGSIDKNYFIILRSDGSFELWEYRANHVREGWERMHCRCGRWREAKREGKSRQKIIAVTVNSVDVRDDLRAIGCLMVTEAAKYIGRPELAEPVRRNKAGLLVCPSCGQRFRHRTMFAKHLGYDHEDLARELLNKGVTDGTLHGRVIEAGTLQPIGGGQ